jgi:hypothetical protein
VEKAKQLKKMILFGVKKIHILLVFAVLSLSVQGANAFGLTQQHNIKIFSQKNAYTAAHRRSGNKVKF